MDLTIGPEKWDRPDIEVVSGRDELETSETKGESGHFDERYFGTSKERLVHVGSGTGSKHPLGETPEDRE